MPDLSPSGKFARTAPDYTCDRMWAKTAAKRVQDYYWTRGHTNVKVWVEQVTTSTGFKYYVTRSNIVFDCTKI